MSGQELAAELVYSFLLPEVERQTIREKGELMIFAYFCSFVNLHFLLCMYIVNRDQRRHLLAAHRIVHSTLQNDINTSGGGRNEQISTDIGSATIVYSDTTSDPQPTNEDTTVAPPQATDTDIGPSSTTQ